MTDWVPFFSVCEERSAPPLLREVAAKLIISLVRHCDIIPCDKAFYDAGMAAKVEPLLPAKESRPEK